MSETVRVLAVGDPAVAAYTDPERGFFAKSAAGRSVRVRAGVPVGLAGCGRVRRRGGAAAPRWP